MTKSYIKLFPNSFKKKGSSSPDYIVYLSEEGKELRKLGAMWKRESKAGNFYYSGVLETEGELTPAAAATARSKNLTRKKTKRILKKEPTVKKSDRRGAGKR